jgi:hypothetical protein
MTDKKLASLQARNARVVRCCATCTYFHQIIGAWGECREGVHPAHPTNQFLHCPVWKQGSATTTQLGSYRAHLSEDVEKG